MVTKIKQLEINKIIPSKLPLVIGYFSSVHVMHSQLFYKFHRYNVLTFNDIPSKQKSCLYTFEQRIDNILPFNPQNIFIYDVRKHNMKAEDFIQQVLVPLCPSEIVVGTNFKFGSDHKPYNILSKYFKVITVNHNKKISSTIISQLLSEGKVGTANNYLATPYYYIGEWVKGGKQGRKIGKPTINLSINKYFTLGDGVYATKIKLGTRTYKAVTFVGSSKTFKRSEKTLETHVIKKHIAPRALFTASARKNVKIEFLAHLRQNKQFKNAKQLVDAINTDIERAKAYFERNK